MCGRVVEGADSRLSREDAVSLDVAILWACHDPTGGSSTHAPMLVASVTGNVPVDFSGALPETGLPDDELFPLEDPVTGRTDTGGLLGRGRVSLTASGAVEEDPVRVGQLDEELVLGMARDVVLIYAPLDVDSTMRMIYGFDDDRPIDAGFHLYVEGVEVDLTTPIEAELGYVAT